MLEDEIRTSANLITESFSNGNKLLLCGNGGSCADCEHIAGEMVKQFAKERPLNPEIVEKLGQNYLANYMVACPHFHSLNDRIPYGL